MTSKISRLELTWPGKEDRFNPEPRILLEDKEKSYSKEVETTDLLDGGVQPTFDNMLIHGDNLLALKALEQDYAGKVKCIYIDPPYNTGNAFEHYDDGLEHSIWLSLMRDRLEILKRLLSDDGVIFVQIDDNEQAYLKVLMDEIFGRQCHVTTLHVEMSITQGMKVKAAKDGTIVKNGEYIIVFSKSGKKNIASTVLYDHRPNYDEHYSKFLTDDDYLVHLKDKFLEEYPSEKIMNLKQLYEVNETFRSFVEKYKERIVADDKITGVNIEDFPKDGKVLHIHRNNRNYLICNLNGRLRQLLRLSESFGECDDFDNSYGLRRIRGDFWKEFYRDMGNVAKEGLVEFKNSKKPERLIKDIVKMTTSPGDIVLDSFLGSGTTAAVAHKMGRRWIGIEMGEHVYTHCLPRLKKVINGEDMGGITKAVGWKNGGGFKFYELASSLIVQDKYGMQIISDKYNADMLAEAMCKILGYHYKPDANIYWKQGFSSEKSFIYTTTVTLQESTLEGIAQEVGENNLLICCGAFIGNPKAYPNITVKKIPTTILKKCEWGREGYPLNLRDYTPTDKEFELDEE